MHISKLYRESKKPVISCEFFAPKTDAGHLSLYKAFDRLKQVSPAFYSVTYGAGGGTAQPTMDLVCKIQDDYGITAMPHLTCVGHTTGYLSSYVSDLKERGIDNILALRGDAPGGGKFNPVPGGLKYASEVVKLVDGFDHFSIGVAGHPEGHPECTSLEADVQYLKDKLDAGAGFVITQFYFDNKYFFDFVELARKVGIDKPIIPGIIPFVNAELVMRFAKMNHTNIPEPLLAQIIDAGGDRQKSTELGIRQAVGQCKELLDSGVPGIHFFTLNNSMPTIEVIEQLNI